MNEAPTPAPDYSNLTEAEIQVAMARNYIAMVKTMEQLGLLPAKGK
jgi:hypothetical protein